MVKIVPAEESLVSPHVNEIIDMVEEILIQHDFVDCPLIHLFLPGMYIRKILMPANSWVTSMIHKTTHAFTVLKGSVSVENENDGFLFLEAGYIGITATGTRRILCTHDKDVEWVTFHPLPFITGDENYLSLDDQAKVVEGIEDIILECHVNPRIGGVIKNNVLVKTIDFENKLKQIQ